MNPSPHTAVDVGRPAGGKRAPARSREQRLRALAHANRIRTARAALKRDLAARRVEFARILTDPPACAANAKVRDLLLALPGIGPAKADRAPARCRIAAAKTLAGLSDRQRRELTQLLHHH